MKRYFLILIAVCIISFGCGTSQDTLFPKQLLLKIANEKYDNNYEVKDNSSVTYALCFKIFKNSKPGPTPLNYFIFNYKSGKIIFEEMLDKGSVNWTDEYHISVSTHPGILTTDEEENKKLKGYLVDVRTGEKSN